MRIKQYKNSHYWIADNGMIFSDRINRAKDPLSEFVIKNQGISSMGYAWVEFSINNKRERHMTHILVAEMYLVNDDPINKIYVNHLDGNKLNNHHSNLEYCTPRNNNLHYHWKIKKEKPKEYYEKLEKYDSQVWRSYTFFKDDTIYSELIGRFVKGCKQIKRGKECLYYGITYEIGVHIVFADISISKHWDDLNEFLNTKGENRKRKLWIEKENIT